MNYIEALKYIENVNKTFCKPGTERVKELCHRMGDPQKSLRPIHITGTNGKGSTLAMLESVLLAAGYKVGAFSSPAVLDFKEQIRVSSTPISESALSSLAAEAKKHTDGMMDKPTSFEVLTAIALKHFKNEKCDIALIETGLGGRLDATNVFDSITLAIVTGVALDHTAFLGNTVSEIAAEKAGIIKENTPVLFGGDSAEAKAVIEAAAKEKNAPFFTVAHQNIRNIRPSLDGTLFDFEVYKNMRLSLLGLYQPKNAATVLAAVDILKQNGFSIPETAVRHALAHTTWRARFEIIKKDPLVIYDGAHNPQGVRETVNSIRTYFGDKKIILVTGVLKDKDYTEIAAMLASVASHAYTLTPPSPRALAAEEYAHTLKAAGINATPCETPTAALRQATALAKTISAPVVCVGSLYTYAEIIK